MLWMHDFVHGFDNLWEIWSINMDISEIFISDFPFSVDFTAPILSFWILEHGCSNKRPTEMSTTVPYLPFLRLYPVTTAPTMSSARRVCRMSRAGDTSLIADAAMTLCRASRLSVGRNAPDTKSAHSWRPTRCDVSGRGRSDQAEMDPGWRAETLSEGRAGADRRTRGRPDGWFVIVQIGQSAAEWAGEWNVKYWRCLVISHFQISDTYAAECELSVETTLQNVCFING